MNRIIKAFTHQTVVVFKKQLTDNTYHIQITGDCIKELNYKPGQHLHVLLQPHHKGSLMKAAQNRSYSIWNINRSNNTIDLGICTFSNGPGAQWIKSIVPGMEVFFTGPTGKFTSDDNANRYLFIGDITTLPHYYEIRKSLGSLKKAEGIIYCDNTDDRFSDLDGKFHFDFVPKSVLLMREIESCIFSIDRGELQTTMFYLGGDGKICIELNALLTKKLKLNRRMIKTQPFWMQGKTGL